MNISVLFFFLAPQITVPYLHFCNSAVSCELLSRGFLFPSPNMLIHTEADTHTDICSLLLYFQTEENCIFPAFPLLNLTVGQCLTISNKMSLHLKLQEILLCLSTCPTCPNSTALPPNPDHDPVLGWRPADCRMQIEAINHLLLQALAVLWFC